MGQVDFCCLNCSGSRILFISLVVGSIVLLFVCVVNGLMHAYRCDVLMK